MSELDWYVVQTRSHHEALVERALRCRGLETFLPRITVPSRRRDRFRLVQAPLFPGYLFIRADLWPSTYQEVLRHRGVVRILGNNGQCAPVPDDTIHSIHRIIASGLSVYPSSPLRRGMRVRITEGLLQGATGVIMRQKQGKRRLVVSVDLLGRAIAVDLAQELVEPVN
jgi:transcriptional antiterminator NusG